MFKSSTAPLHCSLVTFLHDGIIIDTFARLQTHGYTHVATIMASILCSEFP